MAERVGRGSTWGPAIARVPGYVWGVLLVAGALIVAIVVAIVGHKSNPLSAQVTRIERQSDPAHFTFSYSVTKNPLSIATCTFEVQDEDHDVIATTTQRIEATGTNDRTTDHTITVDTPHQGVTAELDHCQLQKN